ncbi:MAG: tRNA uridine-5-carboxymethylaminomethyl(34) synthesis GTPase MnmE, partial [Candidatus Contendobacter sp.]|nr:tRNA uridine-5-carboxymethylaminomethyl(34) synthesis GTPase MnmE [Candidatus Contendobacter sp.]
MDTIAAIATPPGRGGIGVIRVSGSLSTAIAKAVCGSLPVSRQATFRRFRAADETILDEGIALYFPAPHSFTGEDVLELQGHGGPVVMDLLLARVLELGARPARPGEFSERAFLNDKLDLAQAEAIADLIASDTAAAARAALRSLQGEFSRQVNALLDGLIELRIYVEAAIDFPEEEIDFLADGVIAGQLRELRERLSVLQAAAGQGRLLRDGMTVVIAGRPNAGKSSLLNQLAGREAAIVTAIPGTTRDVLREQINIDGMPLHIIDTAGLRDSDDLVEREGIRRAWAEIEAADRILMVVDDQMGLTAEDRVLRERLPASALVTVVCNKIDLTHRAPIMRDSDWGTEILLSAKTEAGLDLLREHLKSCMG